jgi:D-tyrosyl-tRNA(Tyr) deacylase
VRLIIQRVTEAGVSVDGKETGKIGAGLCVLLGIAKGDTQEDADYLAQKVAELRIFGDESGKMNRSLTELLGEVLVVSEFTLYGDSTKGRRPSFSQAAPPQEAKRLYDCFIRRLGKLGLKVSTGKFQAKMEVALVNDGPVTFIVESS